METFSLSEVQTQYILDTLLRRLTRFDRIELESEKDRINAEIAELTRILESDAELRKLVSTELATVAMKFGTERRTVLLEASGAPTAAVPLQVADDPCRILLSSTGLLARTSNGEPFPEDADARRAKHDVIISAIPDVSTVQAAMRHGVLQYLVKSFAFADLRTKPEAYTELRRTSPAGHPCRSSSPWRTTRRWSA